MCVTYGTHCIPNHPWNGGSPTLNAFSRFLPYNQGSFFLPSGGLGLGGVVNVWLVMPFKTVTVMKGYKNKIDLT